MDDTLAGSLIFINSTWLEFRTKSLGQYYLTFKMNINVKFRELVGLCRILDMVY